MPHGEKSPSKRDSSLSDNSVRDGQQVWFTTPAPIKQLFNRFPLRTYTANELPLRNPLDRKKHNLYIFADEKSAKLELPSFNPGCLKWQAYLKFLGIQFSIVPSNNHASPTGALPFLIPSSLMAVAHESSLPIASINLQRWAQKEVLGKVVKKLLPPDRTQNAEMAKLAGHHASDMRHEAYMSLLDCKIRNAWLYFLYLETSNFATVAFPLYIAPCSSNFLVRAALAHNLRIAAKSELFKQSTVIDVESLYLECKRAFSALSQLLGNDIFFFAADHPGLFDASVFAYTNVLLDRQLAFSEWRMVEDLRNFSNLVQHQQRIYRLYFEEIKS